MRVEVSTPVILLTPNRRLAVFLQQKNNSQTGVSAQEKMTIVPLSCWVEQLFLSEGAKNLPFSDRTNSIPYRLTASEERVVWEKIVADSEMGQALLRSRGAAHMAKKAWEICIEYDLFLAPESFERWETEDSQIFYQWAKTYQTLCEKNGWVDSVTSIEWLIQAISKKAIQLPQKIILFEFEDCSAQVLRFLEAVKGVGTEVQFSGFLPKPDETKHARVLRLGAKDTEEELRCAAHMVKRCLEKNPQAYLGVVVPDLEKTRGLVERIFEEVLPKEQFNVAAPLPLSDSPLIKTALLAFTVFFGKITIEKWSQFLRSPFFGEALKDRDCLAAVDVELRLLGEAEFTLESFVRHCEAIMGKKPKIACSRWLERLKNFLQCRKETQGKKTTESFKALFLKGLEILGWPGDRTLTDAEKAVSLQWTELLNAYVGMHRVLGEHTFSEAVSSLAHLAEEISCSMAPPRVQIHILGILEALGIPFDFLWVTGMQREAWPLEPAPNPFIPLKLQRMKDVPRSSPSRELKMAKRFTEKLCESAKEIIFSYPLMVEERPSEMSPLIAPFEAVTKEALGLGTLVSYLRKIGRVRESFAGQIMNTVPAPVLGKDGTTALGKEEVPAFGQDEAILGKDKAPALGKDEKIRGGTRLLKLQALCPFRAFAEIRLKAEPLPVVSKGLTPLERGVILHEILENFWQDLTTQSELLALSDSVLSEKMQAAIECVFQTWRRLRPSILTPCYLKIEKNRHFALLSEWINLEKTRSPFTVVAHEAAVVVELQGMSFKIRIDRIDRLENQEEILIDYKTGDVSVSHWFGGRPKDPQMPFYCVTKTPTPSGIVFAIVRKGSVKFTGITETEKTLPGVQSIAAAKSRGALSSFSEQCQDWQNSLAGLINEFEEGDARVAPLEGAQTCRTCSLQTLCRVAEVA